MKNKPQGLSSIQVTTTVTLSVIGLTALTIPRIAAAEAGVDGTFAVLLAGLIAIISAGIVVILCLRFPNLTVIEFSQVILGKFLGRLYGCMIFAYAIFVSSYVTRGFADAMKILLLPRTPLEFIIVTMLLLSLYCIQGGIYTIARINELFFLPIIGVIALIILFNIPDVEWFRFRAAFSNGIKPILTGSISTLVAFLGYDILLFLVPFTRDKKKIFLYGTAGLVLPILIYTGLTALMIGIYGASTTSDLVYPTVQLARRLEMIGSFIERLDIFFIIFWILAVFTSINISLYMASISITRLIGLRNYKPFAFIVLPFVYVFSILPQDITQIKLLGYITNYGGALLVVASSIPLLIISIIRKKGGAKNG